MEILQKLTRRQLDVLQLIRDLPAAKKGVKLEDIALSLGVKPPTALQHLKVLQYLGLVKRASGKTKITKRGEACLDEYQRHHRIVENMFFNFRFTPDRACQAAKQIDLILSHDMIEELCTAQGHPKECPHGQPIAACSGEKMRRSDDNFE